MTAIEIIRQAAAGGAAVLLMGGIRTDHSLRCGRVSNAVKRTELFIEFGKGLLQHLAAAGMGRTLQLLEKTLAGEEKTLALPI